MVDNSVHMGSGASSAQGPSSGGEEDEGKFSYDEDGKLMPNTDDDEYGDGYGDKDDDNYPMSPREDPNTLLSDGDTPYDVDSSVGSPDPNKKKKRGMFSFFGKEEVVDPPLPYLGPPTGYYKVMDRTKKAKLTHRRILELVDLEVVDNVMEAKRVVVHPDKERITVSTDQQDAIATRRTKKEIRGYVENNILEIQRNLFWKKTLIEMMNHNFDLVECRMVPKVDHKQSRVVVQGK